MAKQQTQKVDPWSFAAGSRTRDRPQTESRSIWRGGGYDELF